MATDVTISTDLVRLRQAAELVYARFLEDQKAMDVSDIYLSTLQSKQSQKTTVESYKRIARALDFKSHRMIPWETLDFPYVSMIRRILAERYAPKTANLTLSALRSVLRTAATMQRIPFDQYLRVKEVKAIKGSRLGKGHALSAEEVKAFREFIAKQHPVRFALLRGILAVMTGAGLRRDETCRLKLSNYRNPCLFVIGKGNKEREVALDDEVIEELEAWLAVRKTLNLDHEIIFVSVRTDGRVRKAPISKWGLWHLLTETCKQLESATFKRFAPHDLRRTFASIMIEMTGIATTQRLMGHASASTTALYDHRTDQQIREARRQVKVLSSGLKKT